MYKYMTLLLGVAFLAGCCCTESTLPIGNKSSYKTAMGTEYVSAGLIEKTWKTDPKVDGTWPMPKPVDTSMYKDATDGVKGVVTASTAGSNAKEEVGNLFDNNQNTKYCTPNATPWIQYQFPAGVKPSIRQGVDGYRRAEGRRVPQPLRSAAVQAESRRVLPVLPSGCQSQSWWRAFPAFGNRTVREQVTVC